MQQFFTNRLSQNLTALGAKHIDPRFRPGLLFCVDLVDPAPSPQIGAPGVIYKDWGPNNYTVQQTYDANQLVTYDGFGHEIRSTSGGGGDLYLGILGSSVTPTASLSAAAFVKFLSFGNYGMVLGRGISSHPYYMGLVTSSGDVYFGVDRASGGVANFQPFTASLNVWYHFAYTWDGTTILAYVDGRLIGQSAVSGTPGNGNGGIWQIGGGLSDVGNSQPTACRYAMVWNDRVITPDEVFKLYTQGPYEEGPMGPSELVYMPAAMSLPPSAPVDATLPYIKVRHGGTSHGATVRTVSGQFTVNYDDYFVEANTTSDFNGYLFPWAVQWQNREVVIKNTGLNTITMFAYDGATIDGSLSTTIATGATKRFVAGSAEWKVI